MAPPRKPKDVSQRHAPANALTLRPKTDLVKPSPPAGLLKRTEKVWTCLFESDVARAIDLKADGSRLERWIRLVDDWYRTHKAVRAEPLTAGSKGQLRVNPLANHLRFLEESISKTETEFGLTPRARAQLGITLGQAAITAADVNVSPRRRRGLSLTRSFQMRKRSGVGVSVLLRHPHDLDAKTFLRVAIR